MVRGQRGFHVAENVANNGKCHKCRKRQNLDTIYVELTINGKRGRHSILNYGIKKIESKDKKANIDVVDDDDEVDDQCLLKKTSKKTLLKDLLSSNGNVCCKSKIKPNTTATTIIYGFILLSLSLSLMVDVFLY